MRRRVPTRDEDKSSARTIDAMGGGDGDSDDGVIRRTEKMHDKNRQRKRRRAQKGTYGGRVEMVCKCVCVSREECRECQWKTGYTGNDMRLTRPCHRRQTETDRAETSNSRQPKCYSRYARGYSGEWVPLSVIVRSTHRVAWPVGGGGSAGGGFLACAEALARSRLVK